MPIRNLENVRAFLEDQPWAMTLDALDSMHLIVAMNMEKRLSDEEVGALIGDSDEESPLYEVKDGIGVVSIIGPISKRMSFFGRISGGTSVEEINKGYSAAMADTDVKGILFRIESPGGTVDGPFDLRDKIQKNRGQKPTKAFADGQMSSAAYLIGSAADEIWASQSASVGSIGVITAHYDYSQYDKMRGIKRTYLTAGRYKAAGNDTQPLSKEDRVYIQDKLDFLYSLFVDKVKESRSKQLSGTPSFKWADGRVFVGEQSLKSGLVDKIGTERDVLNSFK